MPRDTCEGGSGTTSQHWQVQPRRRRHICQQLGRSSESKLKAISLTKKDRRRRNPVSFYSRGERKPRSYSDAPSQRRMPILRRRQLRFSVCGNVRQSIKLMWDTRCPASVRAPHVTLQLYQYLGGSVTRIRADLLTWLNSHRHT